MDEKFLKAAIVRCLRGSGLFLSWSRAPRCLSAASEPPTVVALTTTHSVKEGNLTLKYWCLCPVLHYGCFWKFFVQKVFETNLNSSYINDWKKNQKRKALLLLMSILKVDTHFNVTLLFLFFYLLEPRIEICLKSHCLDWDLTTR